MRRADREITDDKAINQFVDKEKIMRIAFYDNGDIYIVPLNYGHCLEKGKHVFYFHGAKAGRKYDLSMKTPNVGFEIDGKYELIEADTACNFSAKFQSVIGTGKLSVVDDHSERLKGLNVLMNHITGVSEWNYESKMLQGVAVFRLDVEKMTCKAK